MARRRMAGWRGRDVCSSSSSHYRRWRHGRIAPNCRNGKVGSIIGRLGSRIRRVDGKPAVRRVVSHSLLRALGGLGRRLVCNHGCMLDLSDSLPNRIGRVRTFDRKSRRGHFKGPFACNLRQRGKLDSRRFVCRELYIIRGFWIC